ncbi:hypothetical protein I4U23_025977 [Adineta vaga]|nr:hypothetical protein I4U23_025977 [Adineta vaga]
MKTHSITILICTIVVMMILNEKCVQGADDNRFEQESVYANRFLKRTFFHPGSTKCEEQKREAREDYEERCEPSFPLFRNTGTRRFCPDIHNWKELDNYEIGDGYESRDPISGNKINTNQNKDRSRYNVILDPDRSTTDVGLDRNGDYDTEKNEQE